MESGVSIAYISDLERGNLKNPSLATLSKIAQALGISVDYLLGDPQEQPRGPEAKTPEALTEFGKTDMFKRAVADMAQSWGADTSALADEWMTVLGAITVAGRQPDTESDWLFVFETIRRALDR